MFLKTIMILCLAATSAWADHDDHDVGVGHYNRPGDYRACQRLTGRENQACTLGVQEATRMAERWATANGYKSGYLRGFSRGMYQMTQANRNDSGQMQVGASQVATLQSYLNSARDVGAAAGRQDGSSDGSSEAVRRFYAAVGSGQLPSQQFSVPATNYYGVDNGYSTNGPGIVKNEVNFLQQDLAYLDRLDPYTNWDDSYENHDSNIHIWTFWLGGSYYDYDSDGWINGDRAADRDFPFWRDRMDHGGLYRNLNNPPLMVQDGVDAQGKPKYKQIDLQQTFRQGFYGSYGDSARYFFGEAAHKGFDRGFDYGNTVGQQLGMRLAQQTGLISEFNARFKLLSAQAYPSAYGSSYSGSFQSTYSDYATHPKLEVSFDKVIGQNNDGILSPGEPFAVTFNIRNIGGVGTNVTASVAGNVVGAQELTQPAITALMAKSYTTAVIGTIDPGLATGTKAEIDLIVNGSRYPHAESVFNQIGLVDSSSTVDVVRGEGSVIVDLTNLSTIQSAGDVQVSLTIGGQTITEHAGFVAAKETKKVSLKVSGLDPLTLITKGMRASFQIIMTNKMQDAGSVTVGSDNMNRDLATYFDQLANGKGVVGSATSTDARLSEVSAKIMEINHNEVTRDFDGNPWDDSPATTILGNVVNIFKFSSQTPASKAVYDSIGKKFWDDRTNLGQFVFKSGARVSYETLTGEIMLNQPKR